MSSSDLSTSLISAAFSSTFSSLGVTAFSTVALPVGAVVRVVGLVGLAGGFYYRMGRWIGEPYIKNAVNKAESLCFPAELISILAEYYGEEQLPSSPESALVHMVDAVVIRLEAMEQNVGQSVWNRDIVIYQTVNDFSSSEIYDHSGMSMNQFLKIREFLAKEELLR